jgi:hypothetical protein
MNIFSLRGEPGFPEICRRLSTRPTLRSAFYEASAAEIYQRRGFLIHARPETGTRGQDFDFSVVADGESANVEATAVAVRRFSARTIRHALNRKRSQLPTDKPAMIVCFIPGLNEVDLPTELSKIGWEFLRGTRRINYVIFVLDFVLPDDGDLINTRMDNLILGNASVRHQSSAVDQLMRSSPVGILAVKRNETWIGPNAFELWVNWLRGRLDCLGQFYRP